VVLGPFAHQLLIFAAPIVRMASVISCTEPVPSVTLQGRTVSFRNAVIIMTSNLGSADILAASRSAAGAGDNSGAFSQLTRDRVMTQVLLYFSDVRALINPSALHAWA